MRRLVATACVVLVSVQAYAQSEAALKGYFEGKTVVLKIDMPAVKAGIDVYADAHPPLDVHEYIKRIKERGVALRSGASVTITRVTLKGTSVRFLLGGLSAGARGTQTAAEHQVPVASTIHVHNPNRVPASITPGQVMAALAEYIEFPFTDRVGRPGGKGHRAVAIHKGMTWQQAQLVLGAPESTSDRMEGTLKVTTAIFTTEGRRVEAEFVEGVLIRYSMSTK